MFKRELKKGFTLIEILVTVSIIGFLTTIVLVSLNSAKEKAQETANIRQLDEVKKALAMFYADNGYYPDTDIEGLGNILSGVNDISKVYIPEITKNPRLFYFGINCSLLGKCSEKSLILIDKEITNYDGYKTSETIKICLDKGKRLPSKIEIDNISFFAGTPYHYLEHPDGDDISLLLICVRE